ncbi:MAG: PAS domain-containing protein [Verrucomicrobiota bacterium]|nr:PAS domain-containing protein [Verrucomicrobiota bacterium]
MSHPPPEQHRVLLIDDDAGHARLLQELVSNAPGMPFRVRRIEETLTGGLAALASDGFDLVLVDLTVRDSQGLDTFSRVLEAAPDLPIIVLSGDDDEQFALEAVRRGAQEYLVKNRIDGHLLHRAMIYAIERKRSEAALAHERDLLQTLLENLPDRIYFKDRQSRFIRINPALMQLFRLNAPEEAYGKTDADFYGEEHAREALEDERRVMETGEPIVGKVEYEVMTNGRISWSLTTKMPLRDREGRVIGTCGISREISELKAMEQRLATERNLLRAVIDNLPDHIFLKDINGVYLLDNLAHQRWVGASDPSEVLGRTVFDFYPEELAAKFHADDEQVVGTGEPMVNKEERILDSTGRVRWALTTKVPWRGDDGALHGLVCIARDITEQREAQESLRLAYADLERSREELLTAINRLQAAHGELHAVQMQLIEAEKMKSVGRLAAGVAHEVKNPLAVLRIGTEFLGSQEIARDTTIRTILGDMKDAVDRADGVICGLLDFSAPKKLEVQPQDLNEIIKRALTLVRGDLRGARVVRELQPHLPKVQVDGVKIGQVFINLLTNAIHAIGERGTLTVRTYSKLLTGVGANVGDSRSENFRVGQTLIVAEVDDTGPGIPEDKLSKVFEPFYTTKPTGKGTGLGLSVVKTIVDLHGATIDIRNLPEGGARATLMFRT